MPAVPLTKSGKIDRRRSQELDLRRRNCKSCTRWKHAIDFPWRWKKNGKDLPVPYIGGTCLVCKSKKEKKKYHTLTPEEKEERIKRGIALAAKRRQEERQEAEVERRRANELEKRIGTLEDRRQEAETARRRADELEKRVGTLESRLVAWRARVGVTKTQLNGDTMVDLLPFRMFLLRQARLQDGPSSLALKVGVDESRVRRLMDGFYWEGDCRPRPIRQVNVALVDEFLVRLTGNSVQLWELYPELYD